MGEAIKCSATITVDGPRTIDATEQALKHLREKGRAPGNARVTIAGAGPDRFIASAEWLTRDDSGTVAGQDQGESETLQP
jgi:hypothetical protein